MLDRSRRVVLLIDYDNLQICASRDTPGRDLQLTPVVQLAQRYGTVVLARAYAEWNLSTERLAVYKAGIEPAFAPVLRTESDRSGKSLADTVMVAEGMDMLWTLSPDVVVLATSDKDLIPLVRVAKQRGAFVVVLGSDFTAIPLREMADEHITYRQLISEATSRGATEAGPGRQPAALPEPSRRRSRDRNGRERGLTPPPTGAPAAARPERETVPSRTDREPSPAQPERDSAAGPQPTAEPVAPVTAGAPADAEQTGGRRRRRRGSRRRADRVGLTAEGAAAATSESGAPAGADSDAAYGPSDELIGEEVPATPTSSAVDIARASDATVELPSFEESVEPASLEATLEVPSFEAAEPESADLESSEPPVSPSPAARERRRRTRRRVSPSEGQSQLPETGAELVEGAAYIATTPAAASAVPEQSADILPAPPPAASSINGPTSPEPGPTTGEEAPAAAPKPRPRRVASASRGRSRRP